MTKLNFAECPLSFGKICCTCEYWDGERELSIHCAKIYGVIARFNPQGRCPIKGNTLAGYAQSAKYCKEYKKWHMLP